MCGLFCRIGSRRNKVLGETPQGEVEKLLILVLLPEPSPRLLTGGASAKNLPPAGFLYAAGFPLFSSATKIHPFLRFFAHGVFRHLRMPTRGFAPGPHFIFSRCVSSIVLNQRFRISLIEKKTKQKKLNARCAACIPIATASNWCDQSHRLVLPIVTFASL